MKILSFILIVFLFFTGCAVKEPYAVSKSYFMVIKNSKMSIGDTGFIKKDKNRFNLQLFSASTPVLNLKIEDDVCLDEGCLSKKRFNEEFFSFVHYESFIDELFRLKPIYKEKNMIKTDGGFTQKIEDKNMNLIYKVDGKNLYFKDRKNGILIKFKELK